MAFLVSGVGIMLFGLVPFRTCPLLAQMFVCPLSFFLLFGVVADDVFLSFFLSQALGKPKPLLGFGFPLVFSSSWTRTSSTTRTSSSAYTKAPLPHLFFFFFPSSSSFAGCWLVWWRSVVRSVFVVVPGSVWSFLHARCIMHFLGQGVEGTRHSFTPLGITMIVLWVLG